MNSLISQALAVPEIQAGIFLNKQISVEDLTRLMLVNHQWAVIIRPLLWYHYDDRYSPYSAPKYPKLTMACFVENAGRIRSMIVQTTDRARWLTKVHGKDKRRWQKLFLLQSEGYGHPEAPEDPADIMSILQDCCQLRSLGLRLTLDQENRLFNNLDDEALNTQSVTAFGLPRLKLLNLSNVRMTDRGLGLISTYCPRLETLLLDCLYLNRTQTATLLKVEPSSTSSTSPTTTTTGATLSSKLSTGHRDWSSIRKLTLESHDVDWRGDNEDLLGHIVLAQCQKIQELTVERHSFGSRDDRPFLDAIIHALSFGYHSVQKSLKLVNFRETIVLDNLGQLLETFKAFPESLIFKKCDFRFTFDKVLSDPKRLSTLKVIDMKESSFPGNETFLRILLNCPQLVSFKVDSFQRIQASALESTSLDWVCTHLELFECHVVTTTREFDDRRLIDPDKQAQFELDQTTIVVEQGKLWCELLFKQLARLQKLKQLKIDIELPRHIGLGFEVAPLWMYKNLEVAGAIMRLIDIRAFFYTKNGSRSSSHTIMSSTCVDWCRSTWPAVEFVEYEQEEVKWDIRDRVELVCGGTR